MREPVGECHSLAVIACSRNRLTWHVRQEAGRLGGSNKLMINKVQTHKNTLMSEVTGKPVAVDTSENTRQSQGNLLR